MTGESRLDLSSTMKLNVQERALLMDEVLREQFDHKIHENGPTTNNTYRNYDSNNRDQIIQNLHHYTGLYLRSN